MRLHELLQGYAGQQHCIPSRRRRRRIEARFVLGDSPFVCRKARVLLGSVGCSEFDIEEPCGGRESSITMAAMSVVLWAYYFIDRDIVVARVIRETEPWVGMFGWSLLRLRNVS